MVGDVTFSALTDVGRKREHNEDNFLVDKKLGLFVVCDGMGGHAAGEIASALAVRVFHEEVRREADLLADFAAAKTGMDRVSTRDILNMMEFAANRASARVYAEAATDEKKRGMGTTLVAAIVCGNQLFVTWVGDSRLYLLRDGLLEQLTEDHNVFNELVKRKKMPREKVEKLAQKNAITRAVGVYEHAEPESLSFDLVAGDRLLLCSDGLYQYFEEDLDALAAQMSQSDLDLGTKALVDRANESGGIDNITSILVSVGATGDSDAERARKLHLKRELLSKMRLFRPLNDRELLRVLQVTEVLSYHNDDVVMAQGESGEELFIVLEGSVKVFRGDALIATLNQGSHVGEMSLVRNQPRSATVKSSGDSELMVIRRRDFFELLRTEHALAVKLLWQFLGVVADRLAETSRELGQAREELAAEDLTEQLFDEDEDDDARPTLAVPRPVGDLAGIIDEPPPAATRARSSAGPVVPPASVRPALPALPTRASVAAERVPPAASATAPSAPALPGLGAAPAGPSLPTASTGPSAPALPTLATAPSAPPTPHTPSSPSLPSVPAGSSGGSTNRSAELPPLPAPGGSSSRPPAPRPSLKPAAPRPARPAPPAESMAAEIPPPERTPEGESTE
jgi:PPM family protein phosphatase